MKGLEPRQGIAAGAPNIARTASRRHLRLIEPPTDSIRSAEHAHELPRQRINHDVDPDDPPLTVLAW
jgi:hypothetical protein